MSELMTSGDAAKSLGLTPQAIREAVNRGRIKVATTTVGGVRLFEKSEIERFRAARQPRKETA